ncbi:hypothetical protein ACLOJK_033352 [Asimina triloba]
MIIRGKDKGETGIIKRVIRSQNRVIVEGKNLGANNRSNFTKPCKVGIRYMEDGTKGSDPMRPASWDLP